MKKIIQIVEGRTISCLTEDGKVYHWLTYYDNGKEKVFKHHKDEEGFEKVREWVLIDKAHEIRFYTEKQLEQEKEDGNPDAEEYLQD